MNYLQQQLALDIDFPIIQAPMAGVQESPLAIAVANAGGLGSLPCAMFSADKLRQELKTIRSESSRAINVNFFCHQTPTADANKESAWLQTLAPYYSQLGLDQSIIESAPARRPFNEEFAEVLEELKPAVVSFHFGLPNDELLKRLQIVGAKIFSTATTLDEGKWLEEKGVDAVIAQGIEAGGHRGIFLSQDLSTQIPTYELLQQLVNTISVPIIAAGGIASSADVRQAFELGASAVQVGTSFLRCHEASTSAIHRRELAHNAVDNTVLTNIFTGKPARAIRNRLITEIGALHENLPDFPGAANAILPLRKLAQEEGLGDFSSLWCGMNVSGCRDVAAEEIMQELVAGIP